MAVSGDPSLWEDLFPDGLVPDVLDLVVESWTELLTPDATELETRVTERFLPVLRRNKKLRRLPFVVDREIWRDEERGSENARIDLRFLHGHREEVHLAFECKRLNVPFPSGFKSLAGEYVEEGMVRFVSDKYSRGMRHGGMIGYVMNGDAEAAVAAVEKAINARAVQVSLTGASLAQSSLVPTRGEIRETRHLRGGRSLTLHHLFLALRFAAAAANN